MVPRIQAFALGSYEDGVNGMRLQCVRISFGRTSFLESRRLEFAVHSELPVTRLSHQRAKKPHRSHRIMARHWISLPERMNALAINALHKTHRSSVRLRGLGVVVSLAA